MRPLLNFSNQTLDPIREMLMHPTSAWGLGDGGAHCGTTCDASTPTFMLTHWVRDRVGERLPLDGMQLHAPEMVYDLPGEARRFTQRADGYVATVVNGEITMAQGEETGARPGRLLRGAR